MILQRILRRIEERGERRGMYFYLKKVCLMWEVSLMALKEEIKKLQPEEEITPSKEGH